ncbi:hypothetical protein SLEP1_g26052 [Rubroshorea leprosula]|uniref:Uncharacterized protein n=1 Tax=Rubroshorea leprosula TaxID=152421 RepID=A0AAV5JS56_9ROSI|nr:hypothetical protein SLEP1_g26052 [Rubroshorea leprosula]
MKPSTGFMRKLELLVEPIWVPLKTQHWVPWENPALGTTGDVMNSIWVSPGHASPVLGDKFGFIAKPTSGSLQNPHRVHCKTHIGFIAKPTSGSLQNPHRVHCIPRGTQCWVLPWNPMLGFERNPDGFHEELWVPREPSAGFHEEPRSGFLEPSTGFLWVSRAGSLVNPALGSTRNPR